MERSPFLWLLTLGSALGLSACGPDRTPVGRSESALYNEILNGAAEAVWRDYDDGEIARVSYASPAMFLPGSPGAECSGAMIGPNIYMSAAHCGQGEILASFLGYSENSHTAKVWENFACHSLLSTWHSSDLVLYFCDPNAAGENPGDKYGYLDLDRRPPAIDTRVYSIWANSFVAGAVPDVRLYSRGKVTSTTGLGTFTTNPSLVQLVPPGWIPGTPITGTPNSTWRPNFLTSVERPIAVETNLWAAGVSSGSAQISEDSHRLRLGPLSLVSTEAGPFRATLSMERYLSEGYVNCGDPTQVRGDVLAGLMVPNPQQFCGLLDKDGDGVFDVQQEIERLRGEARRPVYYLGFESERRNKQWRVQLGALPAFDPPARELRLRRSGSGYTDLVSHRTLNVASGNYRLGVQVRSNNGTDQWLWLSFYDPGTGSYAGIGGILVPADGAWHTAAVDSWVPASSWASYLVIGGWGNLDVALRDPVVLGEDATLDFESADKRQGWRSVTSGARSPILPRGNGPGAMNFALKVASTLSGSMHYVTSSDQLALVPGRRYIVCADVRAESGAPQGALRIQARDGEVTSRAFFVTGAWQRFCSLSFTAGEGSALQLGFSGVPGVYFADNILVVRQP